MINGVHTQKIYKLTNRIYKIKYCHNPRAPFHTNPDPRNFKEVIVTPFLLKKKSYKLKHLFWLTFEIPLLSAPKISLRFLKQ